MTGPLFRSLHAVKPGAAPRIVARMPINLTLWDAAADGRLLIAQTDDRAAMIARQAGDASERDLSWLDASWVADVSRDGRKVLFSETGQGVGATPAAYLRGMDGSPAVRLGDGNPLALSPDAQWALILDTRLVTEQTSTFVTIVPTGAGESRRLTDKDWTWSGGRWLPDGSGMVLRAAEPGHRERLYRLQLPDRKPQPFTPEGIGQWVLSPDGATVAAEGPERKLQLYPTAGGAPRALPGSFGGARWLAWTDQGLLFMRPGDAAAPSGEVYALDPATGRTRSWATYSRATAPESC